MKNRFEIIDIHAHIGSYFEFPIRQNNINEIMETAQDLGIKKMCVSHMYGFLYDSKKGNDFTIEAAMKIKDFFMAGGVLDPRWSKKEIEEEFLRCDQYITMWNELHPALHQYPIDGKGYRFILDLIKANPKPVLFHTDESDKYSKIEMLRKIIPFYTEIPFIIGHSGNVIEGFQKSVELAQLCNNVFLDGTFSRNYFGLTKWMVDKVGAGKILFGSDVPFLNAAAQIGKFYEPGITDNDRRKIFYTNAARLLGVH